jgi:membrane dipeptidase
MLIVDGHEDIAWNVLALGRNVLQSVEETRQAEENSPLLKHHGDCMLGLPEWLEGGVAVIVGSLFLSPARPARWLPWNPTTYANQEEAHRSANAQLDVYHRLSDQSDRIVLIERRRDWDHVFASWEGEAPQVGIFVSMEGADPIRRPAELEEWAARGVRGIGLAWTSGSCYAGGNGNPGPLSDEGRALLKAMAEFGMLLDVSHLAEEAFWEALDRYEGPVGASHSNPRALVPGRRQLSDAMIRAVAERDGVVGIALYNPFLRAGWIQSDGRQSVTLQHVAAAIDHVCQVLGSAAHVGLGSDLDGGFGAQHVPIEIETVADLRRIGEVLNERGYSGSDVTAVMGDNWARLLRQALPE